MWRRFRDSQRQITQKFPPIIDAENMPRKIFIRLFP
jgi:hypothetical protein